VILWPFKDLFQIEGAVCKNIRDRTTRLIWFTGSRFSCVGFGVLSQWVFILST
jgi:hypothetical protein